MVIRVDKVKQQFIVEEQKHKDHLTSKGFGEVIGDIFVLSIYEVLYLLEKRKVEVYLRNRELSFQQITSSKTTDITSYRVYRDLKKKGYHIKSGLKYGFTFRVYNKGVKQGEDHALWLVQPVHEDQKFSVREFAGKNRVAHSTKKKLLLGIVDDSDVTYLEVNWRRL